MNGFVMKFNAGNAYANLEMSPNDYDFVEGVLYELTPKQMKSLEKFEGFPFFYQKMVFPYKTTQFYTFISVNPRYKCSPKLLPTIEYLGHLTKGCRENKLARTLSYIQDLYKLPSKF